MLSELETRLADVLGTQLPAPFAGRVRVRPETAPGSGPTIQLAVTSATPVDEDFRSVRPERLPGETQFRRIVRLRCEIAVDVVAGGGAGRSQEMAGVDRLLFLLDDGEIRDGTALVEPGDQGFRLDAVLVASAVPPSVNLTAEGWFWPVGEAAQDGPEIEEARVRQALLPIRLDPDPGRILAGGTAAELTLVVGTSGIGLSADQPPAPMPYGSLALRLAGDGGQPGAGVLTGGTEGPDGRRIVAVADGTVVATYTPPATPAGDSIVVASFTQDTDGEQHVGPELARFRLDVVAAP